jgi:predicted O-linked N-acetylglucosamine transferase (SPINDLY family)
MSAPPATDLSRSAAAARNRSDPDASIASLQEIVQREPGNAQALNNLGFLAFRNGSLDEAVGWYEQTVAALPAFAAAWCNLATAHAAKGNTLSAEECYRKALSLQGDLFEAQAGLGRLFEVAGDLGSARDAYCAALRLRPTEAHLHFRLGVIMRAWQRLDRAAACFCNALRLKSDHIPALANLGETLQAAGDIVKSEACLRSAITRAGASKNPRLLEEHLAFSNLFLSMQYNPAYSAREIYLAHRRWGEEIQARLPASPTAAMSIDSGRKLRLGYVSADFCRHPAGRFLEPLLRYHDRERFEIVGYSCGRIRDDKTAVFAGYADEWRDIRNTDDEAAAAMIRSDRIDILIDSTGHMADNRLPLFVRGCAPLQISWIGYPGTTGLSRIDYRFTDAIVDPPLAEENFTERLFRLPHGFCCFLPPEDAPAVTPLPALTRGFVTFGSLHSPARLNPAVIALWSRVLERIPRSRLLIFRTTLNEEIIRRISAQFHSHGIDTARVDFRYATPSTGHLALYDDIDLALDTFPWSGHTTACEALWMGVPHVTLRGDRHAGRMTAGILSSVNLPGFIAENPDAYVALAERAGTDLPTLATLRATMRERLRGSPLCNGPGFTASVEAAYGECFRERCSRG